MHPCSDQCVELQLRVLAVVFRSRLHGLPRKYGSNAGGCEQLSVRTRLHHRHFCSNPPARQVFRVEVVCTTVHYGSGDPAPWVTGMAEDETLIVERGLLAMSDAAWDRRYDEQP